MRFSFVFADGRMRLNGVLVEGDSSLCHFELPRAAALDEPVKGTVHGEDVVAPVSDLLGAIRNVHGGPGLSWINSGARAQLTGGALYPHDLEEGRRCVGMVGALIERGELLGDVEPPTYLEDGRRTLRWVAVSVDDDGNKVEKRFSEREQAQRWLQRRAFARKVGWRFVRTDQLFDDPSTNPTFDEILDLSDFFGEPPSDTLARAMQDV